MKRVLLTIVATIMALMLALAPAHAGNAHFVGKSKATTSGNSLTVSGKIAGLGNEAQVHVHVTAEAQCVNRGGNKPRAGNKQSAAADGVFPVQNGKANFSLTLTASFQPDCSPPMTIVWSNIVITDLTHGITQRL